MNRYETMSEANVRHIKEYNKLTKLEIIERFKRPHRGRPGQDPVPTCPTSSFIIDELADLMMTSKEVEGHIVRIAQKARAVASTSSSPPAPRSPGRHRPHQVQHARPHLLPVRSRLDSRIMLDQSGGELLLGQGDMLMLKPTGAGLCRAQGAFVDDHEIKNVGKFLKEIAEPEFHPELMQLGTAQASPRARKKTPSTTTPSIS